MSKVQQNQKQPAILRKMAVAANAQRTPINDYLRGQQAVLQSELTRLDFEIKALPLRKAELANLSKTYRGPAITSKKRSA